MPAIVIGQLSPTPVIAGPNSPVIADSNSLVIAGSDRQSLGPDRQSLDLLGNLSSPTGNLPLRRLLRDLLNVSDELDDGEFALYECRGVKLAQGIFSILDYPNRIIQNGKLYSGV